MQITAARFLIAAPLMFLVLAVKSIIKGPDAELAENCPSKPGSYRHRQLKDRALLKVRVRDLWMFVGTGIVSLVLFNALYFHTMVESQASVAVVLLYTSPAFVMLLSAPLFRERITSRKLLCLGMTVLGCALVSGLFGGDYRLSAGILLAGLGSGFFYALYTVFARFALRRYDSLTVTAYTFLFAALGSLPFGRFGETAAVVAAAPGTILLLLGSSFLCTLLPYLLYTWGLQRMESGRAAILAAVEPMVGAVLGMTLYREPHSPLKLLGILLILGAMVLLGRDGKKKTE